jgi:hypothetical protein
VKSFIQDFSIASLIMNLHMDKFKQPSSNKEVYQQFPKGFGEITIVTIYQKAVLEINGENIEGMKILEAMINSNFHKSQVFTQGQFWIYSIFFTVPFCIQMVIELHQDDEKDDISIGHRHVAVTILNSVCMVTQVAFYLFVEVVQMKALGKQYFKELTNLNDTLQFVIYTVYFVLRMTTNGTVVPVNDIPFHWIILNDAILVMALAKELHLLQVFTNFQSLIALLSDAILEVKDFT